MKKILAVMLLLVVACAAPAILGGATPETTTTNCGNGVVCPIPYLCPTSPNGKCEAPSTIPTAWGAAKQLDAGADR